MGFLKLRCFLNNEPPSSNSLHTYLKPFFLICTSVFFTIKIKYVKMIDFINKYKKVGTKNRKKS